MIGIQQDPRQWVMHRVRFLARVPFSVKLSFLVVVGVVLCAVAAKQLEPFNGSYQNLNIVAQGPSLTHIFGTDDLGRDVASRVMEGARGAVIGPFVIVVVGMLLGATIGVLGGYLGGTVDAVVSRWIEAMYALPWLLVVIVLVGIVGAGYWQDVGVLAILTSPYNARLLRSAVLEQRYRPYLEAALVLGLSKVKIMTRHVVPNILPLMFSMSMLNFGFAILAMSGLSYLGLGVPQGTADWGAMVNEGQALIFQNPMAGIAPALAIMLTATCVTILGDWIYEEWSRSRS